ncbi:efflux RND transporter periplasmic adaptor subunit [Pyxidicoccus fallax]|uniref:Efflux RND transporter periplasmic adaptor subunit n=1 Tax=Pyxidicoccus fallax TaxID=394095 RepID=A0A848L498_9BACT|nr:efflux RND transporter periplasmic adaptor subunit [Pyxidicoccus fallax]NMO13534.1 efflux RND transporter periplasmic adaptor subunit [Pyxidicoccus fallax]NPC76758.1 efflux RND transporter periplasmic adaptor subunit [Pyxidicoccus fallax]
MRSGPRARRGGQWPRWLTAGWLLACAGSAGASTPEAPALPEQALKASQPLLGVVVASQTLDVVSEVEGRLAEVPAHLGKRVQAGEVLASLDVEPLRLELEARKANVRAAEATTRRAALVLVQAKQRLEREERIRAFSAAEAEEAARGEVAVADADVALAQARQSEALARMAQAERDLAQARIRAPFTGTVTEQYLTPGMRVSRATPVVRLVSEELRLRFAVPEGLAPALRVGATVRVRLSAVGEELTGTVDRLSPEVDPASRHQKAEALLQVPARLKGRLSTGLLAEVFLHPEARVQGR